MKPCDNFQAQLLDYLYGLMDPEEVEAFSAHLKDCAGCKSTLSRSESHKQLLAQAARLEFPEVRFDPTELPPTAAKKRPALVGATPGRSGWVRWALAAAVLLAIGGLSIANNLYWQQRAVVARAMSRTEDLQNRIQHLYTEQVSNRSAAEQEIVKLNRDLGNLKTQLVQEETRIRQTNLNKQLQLTISGPPTVEPGALNEYLVVVRNRQNQAISAEIAAKVLDQTQKEVDAKVDVQKSGLGTYRVSLPRNLPVQPNLDLFLALSAKNENEKLGIVTEKLNLVAPVYLTHLMTDKPMYQPGEVVHFRSLTLERFSLKPVQEDLRLIFTLTKPTREKEELLFAASRVTRENGQLLTPLVGPDQEPIRGVGAGDYYLDPGIAGGEYTLTVREANLRFPPQERKFIVNQYAKPRLNKELEFTRKSYGPGDEVVAACKVAAVEGGMNPAGLSVTATVRVDGKGIATQALRTDVNGSVLVRFRLPGQMEKGDGSLALLFRDNANTETLVRPIPIVLKKLDVEFFPEGGDLVAGAINRVYFQARTTMDKPAEIIGRVVDDTGTIVARAQTFNDDTQPGANHGLGRFEFTPAAGRKYELKIDSPAGIEGKYGLADVKQEGVVLTVPNGVVNDKDSIHVVVHSTKRDRQILVGAYCRGRLMDHQRVEAFKGKDTKVELRPESGIGGVYRVTVFEEQSAFANQVQLVPRAERLIYRIPAQRLNLKIEADKKQYVPGDKVNLRYSATNEKGEPAPAILAVSAVDKSVLKLADEKTFKTMPTHFLVMTEVRKPEDLEHADFLLSNHPKAPIALDLLLGTQGWRRFAEQLDPDDFRKKQRDEADRYLVLSGRVAPETQRAKSTNFAAKAIQEVKDDFNTRMASVQERLRNAEGKRVETTIQEKQSNELISNLQAEIPIAEKEVQSATEKLEHYRTALEYRLLPALAAILFIGGAASLVLGVISGTRAQVIGYLTTAVCTVLLLGAVIALRFQSTDGRRQMSDKVAHHSQAKETSSPLSSEAAPVPTGAREENKAGEFLPKPDAMKDAKKVLAEFPPALGAQPAPGGTKPPIALPGAPKMQEAEKLDLLQEKFRRAQGGADKALQDRAFPLGDAEIPAVRNAVAPKEDPRGPGNAKMAIQGWQAANGALKQKMMAGMVAPQLAKDQLRLAPGQNDNAKKRLGGGPAPMPANAPEFAHAGGMLRNGMPNLPPPPPSIVRIYAHHHTHGESEIRSDFAETLFWHPVLILPDGTGESTFDLCDSVTTFQVQASAHTLNGRLGTATMDLESRKALTIEPKLPIEVTANDKIITPLSIANTTDSKQSVTVTLQPAGLNVMGGVTSAPVNVSANDRSRRLFSFQPSIVEGEAKLQFGGQSGRFTDTVLGRVKVVPEGFPVVGSQSDMLEKTARHSLVLPESWIPGTLKYQVTVYPSTLADLQKGLEALLREPNGCFEQSSTTNYPNVLILEYLRETEQAKPELTRRAQELLGRGYQKLTSFECTNQSKNQREGYEWFGGTAPAHEALTAYGLLQFRDMAKVCDVDKAMVDRTKTFLMSRKDGKGGFQRNPRALDSFGRAPEHITNAYIVWALTESGKDDDLDKELAALSEQVKTNNDPYFLGLVANAFLNRDRNKDAQEILKRLTEAQKPDGHLDAAQTSITGSGGRDLQIETTALTVMAWLKARRPDLFNVPIQSAVKWISRQRGGYGGFGSTQSTILTMKALIAFAKANKKTAEAGELTLYLGNQVAVRQSFLAGVEDPIVLELRDADKLLKPGSNELRVEITGKSVFPYTAGWSYQSFQPASSENCPVGLKTSLDRQTAKEGETVNLRVQVENKSNKGQGMAVAIIGLPAGLTLPEDMKKLKDLARFRNNGTERGEIDAWEIRGRELILYWRDLAPDKKIDLDLDLICRVPGEYRGPASRAYLYYNADHKCWVEQLQMKITPNAD